MRFPSLPSRIVAAGFLLTLAFLLAPHVHAQAAKKDDPFLALVRPTEALTPEEEQTKLKVPPGFKVQLFASEPMINKPINMAFDAKGRLWVTSNTEYPFPATKDRWEDPQGSRVRDSKDAIKILEDTDGDGVADKVTDFVDGLNVPIGVLPYGRGCIAWSIPNIWYFEDTDGRAGSATNGPCSSARSATRRTRTATSRACAWGRMAGSTRRMASATRATSRSRRSGSASASSATPGRRWT